MTEESREYLVYDPAIRSSLDAAGCVITGSHLVLQSGRHSDTYIDCDPLFAQPVLMAGILNYWYDQCFMLEDGPLPEVVVAPAVGGVYLVSAFAYLYPHLGLGTAWADKVGEDDKDFALERAGFAAAVRGGRVLVLEDVITTSGSVMKTIAAIRAAGGIVVGVACIVNRTPEVTAELLDVPRLVVGVQMDVESWEPADLPPEILERPIVTNLAHGAEFQKNNPDWEYGFTEVDFHGK